MANNTTINGKTTRKGLIDFIRGAKVEDNNLQSQIEYTIKGLEKNESEVTKSVLYDLAKDIVSALTPAPALVPIENSIKPKLGKSKKTAEPVEETPDEIDETEGESEEVAEKTPAPAKKTGKKSLSKTKKEEVPTVESTDGLTKKDLPMAKIFPKEVDHKSLGKLIACPDKYKTLKEVNDAIEEGKDLIFATYWTKRHIKEFAYAAAHEVPVPKEGFPYDLDTLQTVYVCDGVKRLYALSTYTEAMFKFNEDDLTPVECEANDGSKFKMRYSAGLEYEIYEVVEA